MMTLAQELQSFAESFRTILYYEIMRSENRSQINKFLEKNITPPKNASIKYFYKRKNYIGYNKRKFNSKKNIVPIFLVLANEQFRTRDEHKKAISSLGIHHLNKLSNYVEESFENEEEWMEKYKNIIDVNDFSIVNNLMALVRNDIKPVKLTVDIKEQRNPNYRRNGKQIGYRSI